MIAAKCIHFPLAFADGLTAAYLMFAVVAVAFTVIALSRPTKPQSIAARRRLMFLCIKLALITGAGVLWFARR